MRRFFHSQSLPSIPEGITNEGLLGVLFLILVMTAVLIYVVSKGYLRLGKDGESDVAKLTNDVERLMESCEKLSSRMENLTIAITNLGELKQGTAELTKEIASLRYNIHNNFMPTLAGMALAYMRLAKLDDLANREEKRFKKEGIDPRYPTK